MENWDYKLTSYFKIPEQCYYQTSFISFNQQSIRTIKAYDSSPTTLNQVLSLPNNHYSLILVFNDFCLYEDTEYNLILQNMVGNQTILKFSTSIFPGLCFLPPTPLELSTFLVQPVFSISSDIYILIFFNEHQILIHPSWFKSSFNLFFRVFSHVKINKLILKFIWKDLQYPKYF